MRDKVIALAAVASAGVAIAVGLTIGALGGAFDDTSQTVRPPALRSDNVSSIATSPSSTIVVVPPSPTWQVAEPTTARPTTQAPTRSETTTRSSRRTTSADRTTTSAETEGETDDPTESDEATTTRSSR